MEVTKTQAGDALEVKVTGRLDGYWADHLSTALEQMIREGAHRLRMDLSGVSYMSSAGIGVLVKFYKQLAAIQGSLVVIRSSAQVRKVLELGKLTALLVSETVDDTQTVGPFRLLNLADPESPTFEVREIGSQGSLACIVEGDPGLLEGCRFSAEQARKMTFPDSRFGIGLGAFGNSYEDSAGRFGEFIAAAGAAAYLPTDGTNVPDYLVSAGDFVPEVMTLYSLVFEGAFSHLARFEPKAESAPLTLTKLAGTVLDITGSDAAGVVMVAESAGLIGAALRSSPARKSGDAAPGNAPFTHPEIRRWLSFSAERAHKRSLALVVGVAARGEHPALRPILRPMRETSDLNGHFHAAAFSYRPLKKGRLDLKPTVSTLFEQETLQGVLHLLADDREATGGGESEFVRGACWIGPLSIRGKDGSQ